MPGQRRTRCPAGQGQGTMLRLVLHQRRTRPTGSVDPRAAARRMTRKKRGTGGTRGVTIVVHADGDLESKQYRLPRWAVLGGKWGAFVIAVLVVLFFAYAGPISRSAARVPGLEREVTRLRVENSRVQQLAAALNRAEANYQELRQVLGVKAPPTSRSGGNVAPAVDLSSITS